MTTSLAGTGAQFAQLYAAHARFVRSCLRGLRVPDEWVEDAAQDVFLVACRRLHEFEGRSSARTWIFGIAKLVARNSRRAARRKRAERPRADEIVSPDTLADERSGPQDLASRAEDLRWLAAFLETLDDEKRAVFVLAEIDEIPAPAIAATLGCNVNTVYSRLRAARAALDRAVRRADGSATRGRGPR